MTAMMSLQHGPDLAAAAWTGRTWSLLIDMKSKWLTADPVSGRYLNAERARLTQEWREGAYEAAADADLPKGLACVHITGLAQLDPRGVTQARTNLRPTLRAVIAGLGPEKRILRAGKLFVAKGWGLIADTDDRHLPYSDIGIGERLPFGSQALSGRLIVTITEVPPPPPGEVLLDRPRAGATGVCRGCGADGVSLTVNGFVRGHRQRRIGLDGDIYITDKKCPGTGQPPEPEERQ